jgi:hypothetical protein
MFYLNKKLITTTQAFGLLTAHYGFVTAILIRMILESRKVEVQDAKGNLCELSYIS